jgi:enoyl-CoA hydratase/3-hydroxyacyl-CoA dehydrogenase
MSLKYTRYDKEDRIAWITLNRPEALNALNSGLWREIHQCLDTAEKDEDVRVVVITGTGRAFSAGDDIKEVSTLRTSSEIRNFFTNYAAPTIAKIIQLSKPIIACVNGLAFGGGCELAILCDSVIASEDALFAIPEARVGAYPPIACAIGVYFTGKLNLSMLALTGESITANEAHRIGLVNKVVSSDKLRDVTKELAKKIMLSAPSSIKAIKNMLNRKFQPEELEQAVDTLIALLETEEGREGHNAFVEKKSPKWISKK